MKIHIEASKIFSFGDFSVCNEINLLMDKSKKKLANNIFELEKTCGKIIRNNKKNKMV
jgi:ribosomal protein S7